MGGAAASRGRMNVGVTGATGRGCSVLGLNQNLANPRAQPCPQTVSVNKVLLVHGPAASGCNRTGSLPQGLCSRKA